MKIPFMAWTFVAVILLAGCATNSTFNLYPRPEKPSDEVVTVIVPWQIQIRSVNGQKIPMSLLANSEDERRKGVVPPSFLLQAFVIGP